jgi:hypothetical protein
MSETAPLAETVAAWAEAWRARAAARLIALWDHADGESCYLAADSRAAYRGPAVVGLIQRVILAAAAIDYRPGPLHLRRLAPELGLAFFPLIRTERPASPQFDDATPVGRRVRVTMLMRQAAGRWRVFHYAEAPLAPLLELQAYYEAVAADGLDAMPRAAPEPQP